MYREEDEGGDKDGLEATQVGIGNEGSELGEECWDANPGVDILSGGNGGLMEFFCEVGDEVTRHTVERKTLCYLNNCKQKNEKERRSNCKERMRRRIKKRKRWWRLTDDENGGIPATPGGSSVCGDLPCLYMITNSNHLHLWCYRAIHEKLVWEMAFETLGMYGSIYSDDRNVGDGRRY